MKYSESQIEALKTSALQVVDFINEYEVLIPRENHTSINEKDSERGITIYHAGSESYNGEQRIYTALRIAEIEITVTGAKSKFEIKVATDVLTEYLSFDEIMNLLNEIYVSAKNYCSLNTEERVTEELQKVEREEQELSERKAKLEEKKAKLSELK